MVDHYPRYAYHARHGLVRIVGYDRDTQRFDTVGKGDERRSFLRGDLSFRR